MTEFGKVFAFIVVTILFVGFAFVLASFIRPKRLSYEKKKTYECGEEPIGEPWVKFNIRFYVTALIFLIFDVEVVLLLPWAVVYKDLGIAGFLIGLVFLFLLGIGLVYEWKKGDLEWSRPQVKPRPLAEILNSNEVKKS